MASTMPATPGAPRDFLLMTEARLTAGAIARACAPSADAGSAPGWHQVKGQFEGFLQHFRSDDATEVVVASAYLFARELEAQCPPQYFRTHQATEPGIRLAQALARPIRELVSVSQEVRDAVAEGCKDAPGLRLAWREADRQRLQAEQARQVVAATLKQIHPRTPRP